MQAKNVCLTECKYRNENSLKLFFCFHMGWTIRNEDTYAKRNNKWLCVNLLWKHKYLPIHSLSLEMDCDLMNIRRKAVLITTHSMFYVIYVHVDGSLFCWVYAPFCFHLIDLIFDARSVSWESKSVIYCSQSNGCV